MKRRSIGTVVVAYLLVASTPTYAYLDMGTGSMMVQALLGAAAGALVVGRVYWSKVKRLFTGHRSEAVDDGVTKAGDRS